MILGVLSSLGEWAGGGSLRPRRPAPPSGRHVLDGARASEIPESPGPSASSRENPGKSGDQQSLLSFVETTPSPARPLLPPDGRQWPVGFGVLWGWQRALRPQARAEKVGVAFEAHVHRSN